MNKLIFRLNHIPKYEGFYGLLWSSGDKPEIVRVWLNEDDLLVCGSSRGIKQVTGLKSIFWTDKIECSLEGTLTVQN
jgi:hypothetical protein